MADTKISALTSAATPLAGTEVLPIVQSGSTVKVAVSNLTAGRAISAAGITNSNLTVNRVVYSTSGGAQTDSANLFYNGSNFAVGTSLPGSNVLQTLQYDSGTINTAFLALGYGAVPTISLRSAGGTAASPSATTLNPLNILGATTSDGTAFFNTIGITGFVSGTPTAGSHPTGLFFATTPTGSTGRLERLRIHPSGGVSVGNSTDPGATNLSVTGNLVVSTSGNGIDFSATPGTGTSELLNDYEEGTWTPVIQGSTTAGTASYSLQNGRYTKVGRQVYVEVAISWSGGTGTGNLTITGLPFTSANGGTVSAMSIAIADFVALTALNVMTAFVPSNTTRIEAWQYPTGGGAANNVAYDAGATLYLSGSYTV